MHASLLANLVHREAELKIQKCMCHIFWELEVNDVEEKTAFVFAKMNTYL